MSRQVKFKGSPLTLVGRYLSRGIVAPDFKVISAELKEVCLSEFKDKIKIVNFFPSLDTPVCDLQVKEFNKKAAGISADIVVIGISKDLPFAQARFCHENEIKNELVFSDYRYSSFGINYGVLIKELNLLARGVVIIDSNNILRYIQIVDEVTNAVNYEQALKELEAVISATASLRPQEELSSHCKPCEGQVASLPQDKINRLIAAYRGWELIDGKKIVKEFKFKDFIEAKYFIDLISVIAEEQGHHPTITVIYNKVRLTLSTHAAGGLTDNDFIMAKLIDGLGYAG